MFEAGRRYSDAPVSGVSLGPVDAGVLTRLVADGFARNDTNSVTVSGEPVPPGGFVRGPARLGLDVVYPLRNAAGAVIGLQTSDGEQIEPPARMIVLGTVSGTPRGALTAKAALSAAAGQIGTADSTPTAAEVAALALRVNFVAGVNRAQIAPAAGSVRVSVNALDDVAAFGRLADPVGVDTYVVSAAGPALEIYTGDIDIFALHVVCESGTPVDTTISVVGFAR